MPSSWLRMFGGDVVTRAIPTFPFRGRYLLDLLSNAMICVRVLRSVRHSNLALMMQDITSIELVLPYGKRVEDFLRQGCGHPTH